MTRNWSQSKNLIEMTHSKIVFLMVWCWFWNKIQFNEICHCSFAQSYCIRFSVLINSINDSTLFLIFAMIFFKHAQPFFGTFTKNGTNKYGRVYFSCTYNIYLPEVTQANFVGFLWCDRSSRSLVVFRAPSYETCVFTNWPPITENFFSPNHMLIYSHLIWKPQLLATRILKKH